MSKFGQLFQQPREPDDQIPENVSTQKADNLSVQQPEFLGTQVSESAKKGRAKGKRSNPAYEQVTAYIKKQTYRSVKVALLQEDLGDFSDLVEQLLQDWLNR